MKYSPSLCQSCNNAGTQPYDRAYDDFVSWVFANEEAVLRKRFIDFGEVYGLDFEDRQRDLYKYFVKSFGCRLVDAGQPVPADLVHLLPKSSFQAALRITFCVNEDILLLLDEPDRLAFLGKGDLMAWMSKTDPSILNGYTWNEHVSWLTVCYWYGMRPEGHLGSTWAADAQHVYLGSFRLAERSGEQPAVDRPAVSS